MPNKPFLPKWVMYCPVIRLTLRENYELSAKMGFDYGDALPWFDGRDIRLLANSPAGRHPNAQGHAIVARGIVNLLHRDVFSGID